MKAISARARRIAEALWWVMALNEPYRYWNGERAPEGGEVVRVGNQLVDADTGEVLEMLVPEKSPSE